MAALRKAAPLPAPPPSIVSDIRREGIRLLFNPTDQ
jgi:hypothetical protein